MASNTTENPREGRRAESFADRFHPEERERVWHDVQAAVRENRPFEFEYRIRTADDDERWVSERGHPVWADDGELLGLEGFISDVTAEKLRSEELRRTLAILETLTSQRLFGTYVIHDGVFAHVNETFAGIFGYEREEIEGGFRPRTSPARAIAPGSRRTSIVEWQVRSGM